MKLDPRLREALESRGLAEPPPAQVVAWPPIAAGKHTLLIAPTGGGKTEAYLAVAATVALHRRLTSDRTPGTDVITRYTYRLLTQQQFPMSYMYII